jgi:hypothetical protein
MKLRTHLFPSLPVGYSPDPFAELLEADRCRDPDQAFQDNWREGRLLVLPVRGDGAAKVCGQQ